MFVEPKKACDKRKKYLTYTLLETKKFPSAWKGKKKIKKIKTHVYTKLPTSSPSKVKWSTAKPNSAVVVTPDAKGSVVPDRTK